MPIREKSFRIGCGRYVQEAGALQSCGAEILRKGKSPLIVGGKTALSLTRDQIEKSVRVACEHYCIEEYRGTCNEEAAQFFAKKAQEEQFDVIVGVGGGVIMDFSKLIGYFAALPVINIPTSSATCAAYTPLSVRYTPEGRTVGSLHEDREVDAVLVDTALLATQPARLLLAGVFDAIAKFVEIKQRFNDDTKEYPLGLDWAYILSKHSYKELLNKTEPCLADMKAGVVSDNVEQLIFTAIAATGVISGIARGSNQCAIAHKFYESTRALFYEESRTYLHGEIVGIGLLIQNTFNGEERNNQGLLDLMKKYNMPHNLPDIGVAPTKAAFDAYYERLKNSSAIDKNNPDECGRLYSSMQYLWELK